MTEAERALLYGMADFLLSPGGTQNGMALRHLYRIAERERKPSPDVEAQIKGLIDDVRATMHAGSHISTTRAALDTLECRLATLLRGGSRQT